MLGRILAFSQKDKMEKIAWEEEKLGWHEHVMRRVTGGGYHEAEKEDKTKRKRRGRGDKEEEVMVDLNMMELMVDIPRRWRHAKMKTCCTEIILFPSDGNFVLCV